VEVEVEIEGSGAAGALATMHARGGGYWVLGEGSLVVRGLVSGGESGTENGNRADLCAIVDSN